MAYGGVVSAFTTLRKPKKKKTNGMLINHYTKSVGKEHWGHKMGWEL